VSRRQKGERGLGYWLLLGVSGICLVVLSLVLLALLLVFAGLLPFCLFIGGCE